jgi:hypothetical protein
MSKNLEQIQEENRRAIITACNSEAKSYEEALKMELGFGCELLIGLGIGKKASDKLTISLCDFHHFWGNKGEAIHSGIKSFETNFCTQDELLEFTNKMLGEL